MTNKILWVLVAIGFANLAMSLSVLCNQCDCQSQCCGAVVTVPTAKHERYQPQMGSDEPLPQVNTKALFEKKGQQCLDCPQLTPIANETPQAVAQRYGAQIRTYEGGGFYAALPDGQVWESSGKRGTYPAPDMASLARQMSRGTRPEQQPTGERPLHQLNRGRVLLFVDQSAASATLQGWFDTHPGLRQLRDDCDFVTYRETDPLYKSMFAGQVYPSDFPAIVVADEAGAKIYGAANSALPATPDELMAKIQQGAAYLAESRQGIVTAAGQCYGPDCPYPNQQPNQPPAPQYEQDQRVFPRDGGLVDRLRNKDDKGGIAHEVLWGWMDVIARVALGLVIVLAVLAVFAGLFVYGIARLMSKD